MALTSLKMPQLGESVTEGTVDRWLKKEGDLVKRDEPLVEIVTDKVNAEVPSPFEGRLVRIQVAEGATVPIGTSLAEMEVEGAADYLPVYAGNLDIMTSAGLRTAGKIAERRLAAGAA